MQDSEPEEEKSRLRYVALIIIGAIFVMFSFWMYDAMNASGYPWYQIGIPTGLIWLGFLFIAYVLTR